MDSKNLSLLICLSISMGIIVLIPLCIIIKSISNYIYKLLFKTPQFAVSRNIDENQHLDKPIVVAIQLN